MNTAIIRCGDCVRFQITKHPEFRLGKMQEQMPPGIELTLFGVTSVRSKEIKLRFADRQVAPVWYKLDEEFTKYLSGIIGR